MERIGLIVDDIREAGVRSLHLDLRDSVVDPLARGVDQIDRISSRGGRAAQRAEDIGDMDVTPALLKSRALDPFSSFDKID
jgi:hypothetical protein